MWLYRDVKREEGRWSLARTLGMSLFLMPVVACSGSSSGDGTNTNNTNTGSNKASNVAPQLASESSVFAEVGSSTIRVYFKENVEAAASLRSKTPFFPNTFVEEKSSGKIAAENYALLRVFENDNSRPTVTVTKKGKSGAGDENLMLREVLLANTYKYDSSGNYDESLSSSYFELSISGASFESGETYEVTIHGDFLTNRGRDIKNAELKVEAESLVFAKLVSVAYHKTTPGKEGTVEVVYDKVLQKFAPSVSVLPSQVKDYSIEFTGDLGGSTSDVSRKFDYGALFLADGQAFNLRPVRADLILEVTSVKFDGTTIIFDIKDKTTLPKSIFLELRPGELVSGPDFQWTVLNSRGLTGVVNADTTAPAASHEDELVGLSFLDVVDF